MEVFYVKISLDIYYVWCIFVDRSEINYNANLPITLGYRPVFFLGLLLKSVDP
jgi:hypothetical protein